MSFSTLIYARKRETDLLENLSNFVGLCSWLQPWSKTVQILSRTQSYKVYKLDES